jgi:hypothetical protein
MTTITVSLDERIVQQAEQAASECSTTLDNVIRSFVDQFAASKARFERLAAQWREQAAPLSSSTDRAMLPSYQTIIGMGETALPFILEEMRNRGGHWFWALRAITGENPVPSEHRGNVEAMTQDWLQWGGERGCL